MVHSVKNGGKNPEKIDIMFGSSRGDRFMQRIKGRSSFTHIHESNPKNLVGYKYEERNIPCHGKF